jgi:hypothetical protein
MSDFESLCGNILFYSVSILNTVNRGGISQSLNFKYLYKSHCKSCEMFWVLYNRISLKSPQFIGFAVTLLLRYLKFKLCAISPRLMVKIIQLNWLKSRFVLIQCYQMIMLKLLINHKKLK